MTLCKVLGLFHSQKVDFFNFNISKIYQFETNLYSIIMANQ